MNKAANFAPAPGNAPGMRGIRFSRDWITRPLFGVALAGVTVAAVFGGPLYVAILAGAIGIAGAREWHRMITDRALGPDFFVTSLTIVAVLTAGLAQPHSVVPWIVMLCGVLASVLLARVRNEPPAWQGAGTLYLSLPLLAILLLRSAPHGAMIIIALFVAIWMTDTGALVVGNLAGGPRLWPALSPNKTWSGTLGGVAAAGIAEALFVMLVGGHALTGIVLGSGIAIIAHCGDLFESWVKRVFQRKDSGSMIPGHGGVLDRIDSTLAAAPCLSALVLIAGINPLFGVHA
ncbi:MAG TPA: phosphatidate cytidylyltransferase [Rhizomicrobium sp.]|nr:phosphatidate cytidylyltransferase [Rhizomicrobium sp.]